MEKDIQSACLAYMNTLPGCIAWRMNTGAYAIPAATGRARRYVRFGVKGMSDIIGIIGSKFIAVEIKRPENKPTVEQAGFLDIVNRYGGIGLWCVSVESLELQLRERGLIDPRRKQWKN